MQQLGEELTQNTFRVAEAGLRTGYAYAKAETGETAVLPLLSGTSQTVDKNLPQGETRWTEESLKARFGTCNAAYQYLQKQGVKLRSRSWKNVVDAFNHLVEARPLEQRVTQLEMTVVQQAQYIVALEAKIERIHQMLLS